MSRLYLLRRTLAHYAGPLAAVALGVATATAVIVGALVVGDSVRGSLRQMTLSRLHRVDAVVAGPVMVTQDLAARMQDELAGESPEVVVAPAIRLPGTLRNPDTQAVAGVDAIALDAAGWDLLETSRPDADRATVIGRVAPPRDRLIVPNEAAARAVAYPYAEIAGPLVPPGEEERVGEVPGDAARPKSVLVGPYPTGQPGELDRMAMPIDYRLLVELPSAIPRDTLLGDRDEQVVEMAVAIDSAGVSGSNPIDLRSGSADWLRLNLPRRLLRMLSSDADDMRHEALRTGSTAEMAIAPPQVGASRFALSPSQQLPRLAYVDLPFLQEALGLEARERSRFNPVAQPARVNTLLIAGVDDAEAIAAALDAAVTLDDLDLKVIAADDGSATIETRSLILPTALERAATQAADSVGADASSVLVYLVNEIRSAADPSRYAAYSVAAGLELETADLEFVGERPSLPLSDDQIVLNAWTADDLGVEVGDAVAIDAFPSGSIGDVPAETHEFTVAGIVKMTGDGANPSLTPTVPGVTDADSYGDWEQPFEMDLDRVTDRDEAYWDEHRAAPKAFLSLGRMRELFGSRYGQATSVRVRGPFDADALRTELREAIDPAASGLVPQPIKRQQLAAASGTTDFTGLFLGFSFFLIASAVLLVGLLFRLGVEQRASQLGLMAAVGFGPKAIRRQLLLEGLVVAGVGGLLGLAGGLLFAQFMLYGLTTWWSGAIGTQSLSLHAQPSSLLIGMAASVVTAVVAMAWSVRRLHRLSQRSLLAGRTEPPLSESGQRRRGRLAVAFTAACVVAAGVVLILLLVGVLGDAEVGGGLSARVIGFFLLGMLLLAAAIAALAALLDRPARSGGLSIPSLAMRNASRARGRSLLTASLIAAATFVLVAVATAKRDPAVEAPRIDSGNGGYLLIGETAAPVLFDLNTPKGRDDAAFLADDAPLEGVRIDGLRRRPGDDASCLNLYRAQLPTLIGIPDATLQRWESEGRFRFADTPEDGRWGGLLADPSQPVDGDRVYPVIGDMNTVMYSLHLGVGRMLATPETIEARQAAADANLPYMGNGDQLQIIGMLDSSVFQGVLLMRESHLLELFPDTAGYRTFLVEGDPANAAALATTLEKGLAGYGFDAEPVGERIANFLAVQNTYLATFQALGGLGLLLGTIGLAVVMLRNVTERRGELALLRAVGYGPRRLRDLIGNENAALLLWGVGAGTLAALLAMLPHLLSTGAAVPWMSLLGLLLLIVLTGGLAGTLAMRRGTRTPIVRTMRGG